MRNEDISIVKGIGILLMVLAHAGCPDVMFRFIYLFHMPLFFIISGYCCKEKYLDDTKAFIMRRIKGLYWPFVLWSLVFLALHNVFFSLSIYNDEYGFRGNVSSLYTLNDFAHRAEAILTKMSGSEALLGGFWFLRELFFASIISIFLLKFLKRVHYALILVLIALTLCYLYPTIRLPYIGLNALTLLATLFYIIGYAVKKNAVEINHVVSAIIVVVMLGVAVFAPKFSMFDLDIYTFLPYIILASCGTLVVMKLPTLLSNVKIQGGLVFVGNNTLIILTWHFLSFKLISFLLILWYGWPKAYLACFPVIPLSFDHNSYYTQFWFLYFIAGVSIPLIIAGVKNYRYK